MPVQNLLNRKCEGRQSFTRVHHLLIEAKALDLIEVCPCKIRLNIVCRHAYDGLLCLVVRRVEGESSLTRYNLQN